MADTKPKPAAPSTPPPAETPDISVTNPPESSPNQTQPVAPPTTAPSQGFAQSSETITKGPGPKPLADVGKPEPPAPAPEPAFAEIKTLDEVSEVVVTIGPRLARYKNEMREVEPATQGVYTRAWWQSLYRDQDGDVVAFKATLDGYPIWNEGKTAYSVGPLMEAE